jgi:hypothetical protein
MLVAIVRGQLNSSLRLLTRETGPVGSPALGRSRTAWLGMLDSNGESGRGRPDCICAIIWSEVGAIRVAETLRVTAHVERGEVRHRWWLGARRALADERHYRPRGASTITSVSLTPSHMLIVAVQVLASPSQRDSNS